MIDKYSEAEMDKAGKVGVKKVWVDSEGWVWMEYILPFPLTYISTVFYVAGEKELPSHPNLCKAGCGNETAERSKAIVRDCV
jgi:hypothetical protein